MPFKVKVTGLKQAALALGQSPEVLQAAAISAVNETVERIRAEAVRRASQRINLSEEELSPFVLPRRASVRADGASGSVTLQVKAVPLSVFNPTVRMRPYRGPDSLGRRYRNRLMPQVSVALYRGKRARPLPGGFTLRQRNDGAVRPGERVKKRAGSGFGDRRDYTIGNKLTAFRYYTFPKRITAKLLPELQREAGKLLSISLRVAYRKQFRGYKVLRGNN